MKYLVIEVHPGYAVLLDSEGRFLRAANLGYQVGETVTEIVVMKEQSREPFFRNRKLIGGIAAAACFCLVCLGVWRFTGRDRIIVQEVEIARTEMSIGMNLGSHDAGSDREGSALYTKEYDLKDGVPAEMWELKPSRISGQEVYIGRSDDGTWHAAFEKDGTYIYATEKGVEEEEFTDHLKDIL